jgi:hypothetical protein
MINYLYSRLRANMWFEAPVTEPHRRSMYAGSLSSGEEEWKGVLLRCGRGSYVARPHNVPPQYLTAIQQLNVEVAFTMATDTTNALFETLEDDKDSLVFPSGARYQIVDSIEDICTGYNGRVKKFQYTCIVRKERIVLVWHDDISMIMAHAEKIEQNFVSLMWGASIPKLFSPAISRPGSVYKGGSRAASPDGGKDEYFGSKEMDVEVTEVYDEEKGRKSKESIDRPVIFTSAVFTGLSVGLLATLILGGGVSAILGETLLDGTYIRFALLATIPIFATWGLFFANSLFGALFQIFGPITSVQTNSRYFSAIRPDVGLAIREGFQPEHITIQMPVYKESLKGVIMPTVTSLKAAISQYELKGGTASIFINDDGMQIISEAEAQERKDFYRDNNIGWVARPKHGENGFIRAGKFKKASNMNYALNISNRTEDKLRELVAQKMAEEQTDFITEYDNELLYHHSLADTLARDGRAWAEGNIRMGRYILIVDSDTRVPADCLLYGAAEMFLNPEVAIIQHSAGVMQVVGDYFENGVTYFTNLIYSAIRFAVGSGEVAPFVGHNSFLRYEALQSVAIKCEDGREVYWSESHVSEDFDIALRLQIQGNIVRLAAYHGPEFKEGVSLTIYDELARWEKYAYGCNELVFHPLYQWIYRGPFTKLFRSFVFSGMQISSKISIIGYIATYYALAFSLPLTVLNYFLVGWMSSKIDHYYIESWKVLVSVLVVFSGLSPLALATLRYRLGEKGFFSAFLECLKWLPMFTCFFGGLSFHIMTALFAHAFSINMEWGATAKEATASNFFKEIPKIFKNFKWMYLVTVPLAAGMIYLAFFAPHGWTIRRVNAVVPLGLNLTCHILLPVSLLIYKSMLTRQFVLNPSLMIFNY